MPTLLNIETRRDPRGMLQRKIIEQLSQTDGILDDMEFEECNDGTGHKTTIRTGIPDATWRILYQGTQPNNSTTAAVRDACGILEARSSIDVEAARIAAGRSSDNGAAWRETEESAFRQGLRNGLVSTLIYGNASTNPERFTGIAARFNTVNPAVAATADNVIDAGGTGADNTSIYIHTWHPLFGSMIYPEGASSGLEMRDLPEADVLDASGRPYRAFQTLYNWRAGYSLRDWRGVVRIANVDVSDLTKTGSTGADLIDLIAQGIERLPDEAVLLGRVSIYCHRVVRSFLRRQISNKSNVWLSMGEVGGKKVTMFDEYPIRRCDSISLAEARVV